MRTAVYLGVALTLLLVSADVSGQRWCAYNLVRDARFDCGYSTEKACEAAIKDPQRACTRDPFAG
jgi:hypothetical protein